MTKPLDPTKPVQKDDYATIGCYFCECRVRVNIYDHRECARCPCCGAKHFLRNIYRGGHVVAEEEGWRKDGQEFIY